MANQESLRLKALVIGVFSVILGLVLLGWYWSQEPQSFNPKSDKPLVTGVATTSTLIRIVDTVLAKPGGYLANDLIPPGVWTDNMPNWEFGVLVQVRDLSKAMREAFSPVTVSVNRRF